MQKSSYYLNRHITRLKHYWKEDKTIFFKHVGRLGWMVANVPFKNTQEQHREKIYQKKIEGKKDYMKKTIMGSVMFLPLGDRGLSRDLIIKGVRESNSVAVFEKEFKGDMNVIDIGANIGYYALMELQKTSEHKSKVYAIEPHPKAFEYLKKNIEANTSNNKDVKLFNIGLSYKKDTLPFYMSEGWNWSRFEKGSGNDKIEKTDVEVNTLDNLFEGKKIDFIRMDVEGYEFKILKGGTKLIKNNPQIKIFLEFHANHFNKKERRELIDFFKEHNLRVKYYFAHDKEGSEILDGSGYSKLLNSMYKTYYLLLEGNLSNNRNL